MFTELEMLGWVPDFQETNNHMVHWDNEIYIYYSHEDYFNCLLIVAAKMYYMPDKTSIKSEVSLTLMTGEGLEKTWYCDEIDFNTITEQAKEWFDVYMIEQGM